MKKLIIPCACLMMAALLTSADKNEKVMVKENGTYVVNTTELSKDVIGYQSHTPLKVFIKSNKIQKIEFLPNEETPKYWNAASKHLLNKWDGMTIKDAKTKEVDGRTGATMSSNAVKKNVKLAVEYYEKNK